MQRQIGAHRSVGLYPLCGREYRSDMTTSAGLLQQGENQWGSVRYSLRLPKYDANPALLGKAPRDERQHLSTKSSRVIHIGEKSGLF